MSVIFILIITSLLVAVGFLISFVWAVNNGQYEDDYTASVRILIENQIQPENIPEDKIITHDQPSR